MKKNKINYKLLGATIFLFIALLFSLTTKWALKNFDFTVEELIFHLKVPMKGANLVVLFDFLRKCLLKTFIYVFILTFILVNIIKINGLCLSRLCRGSCKGFPVHQCIN